VVVESPATAEARRALQLAMLERRLRAMQARVAAVTSLANRSKRRS
jgi:hypothetical protein